MEVLQINPDKEYLPLEVAKLGFIRSRLNIGSYARVLRLIKAGRLQARNYEINAKKPYWVIRGKWIIDYLNEYEPGRFEIQRIKEGR